MAYSLDRSTLERKLDNFPSTFRFDTTNLTIEKVTELIQKINDDKENTIQPETEKMKMNNFLSFLHYLLQDFEKALQHLDESLQSDPDNITANANKARILENGEVSDVEDILIKLQALEKEDDYNKRKCHAESDLAYAYSRSGPWYHEKAIDIYERIVQKYPTEYAWKFGLGLTLLRRTHNCHSQADVFNQEQNKDTLLNAFEKLQDVADKSDDPVLCGLAYAALGRAVYTIRKLDIGIPPGIKKLKDGECFEKAIARCPEDPWVLHTSGQFARYRGDLDKSEELLRKSIKIRPTCNGYHHLALTLKRKVEMRRNKAISLNRSDKKTHRKEQELRRKIKSPLKVEVHPDDELLTEAIKFCEEAEKLSAHALNVKYDKGILYCMLGQNQDAVKTFKQIVSKKKCLPNESLLTCVYEQLGLRLLELAESEETSSDMKKKFKKDGQTHLLHALQIQSEIVAKDRLFKKSWNSYATLTELFSDDKGGKPKELAVLHMLMGDHRDSINVYNEILMKDKDKMEPDDYKNMIKCYLKDGQIEECVTLLRSLECTTFFSDLSPSLVFNTYIEGAFHAYTTGNSQLAYTRFRRAFQVYGLFENVTNQTEANEEVDAKDVLVLHSCAKDLDCKLLRNVCTILEDFVGLSCTICTDNVLPNKFQMNAKCSLQQNTACIIIMTHDNEGASDFVPSTPMMSEKKVVVVSDDKCNVPDIARAQPFILMPPLLPGSMHTDDQIPEEYKEWIKTLITQLKPD
ncbi:uncharacterized protein LOC132555199 [Ylistrum balloti]|uniref:uncharacterized protein LOC132555199 n=1 Tax=Ylistrum balloti TaxID=509963 RepID=UPI002905C3C9|nr:uncharacterized protein LOC132555199 [Ylistrum balloti]